MFKKQIEVSALATKYQPCKEDGEFCKENFRRYLNLMIRKAAPMFQFIKACPSDMTSYLTMVSAMANSRIKILAGKSYYMFHQLRSVWDKPNHPVGLTGYIAGVLSVEHVQMWKEFKSGNIDKARQIWYSKILPLVELMYGSQFGWSEDIMPLEVLKQMGIIKTSRTSHSTKNVSDYPKKEIAKCLELVNQNTKVYGK